MDTIKEIQERIVEEFSMYDEWLDKYEYLIELGKSLEPLEDRLNTEDRLTIPVSATDALSGRPSLPPGQTVWPQ